jgi:hypothetical protein
LEEGEMDKAFIGDKVLKGKGIKDINKSYAKENGINKGLIKVFKENTGELKGKKKIVGFLKRTKDCFRGKYFFLMGFLVTIGLFGLFVNTKNSLAQGLGEIGGNITSNIGGVAKAIIVGGFALGLFLVISGLVEFYNANRKPNSSFGGGAIKCAVGACLLAIEAIIASFSSTIFGGNESGTGLGALGF